MKQEFMDLRGLKCPQPIIKLGARAPSMTKGDVIEAVADCHTFENDVRKWCERLGKTLLWVKMEDEKTFRVQIQL